ncbi:MAG: signal peptidase I [Patescibacteria group bacterium]|jgi:signal peptidase I
MNNTLEKFATLASWLMLFGRGILLSVILLLIIMRSLITAVKVDGHSMDPTLKDKQWVLVDLVSKNFNSWNRGDVVILRFPGDPLNTWYVKRIIGIPGDQIKIVDDVVYRNNQKITEDYLPSGSITFTGVIDIDGTVPNDQYLVLGDNRQVSNDSRFFGYVPKEDLFGKVIGY